METREIIVVPAAGRKMRLEDFLLAYFPRLSKMYLRDTVNRELCEVNGRWENIGYRLRPNDLVEIVVDTKREASMLPSDIPLDITYEDEEIIALNKPYGVLVHPSHRENRDTIVNGLVGYLNRHEPSISEPAVRPGLPHRLDKETSGVLLAAKTKFAQRRLTNSFTRREIKKRYLAIVIGRPEEKDGEIRAPIGRDAAEKIWKVCDEGKEALTRFSVLEEFHGHSLVELEPVTGRTNQLRIHLAAIGCPILGDHARGGGVCDRLYLHAYSLELPHPRTREPLFFKAPLPDPFAAFLINERPNG